MGRCWASGVIEKLIWGFEMDRLLISVIASGRVEDGPISFEGMGVQLERVIVLYIKVLLPPFNWSYTKARHRFGKK